MGRMPPGNSVVFRCDGTRAMGLGHVARCVALALAARDAGWKVSLVIGGERAAWRMAARRRLPVSAPEAPPGTSQDAAALSALAAAQGAVIVVDGYHFRSRFYQRLRANRTPVLAIDDLARNRFPVDAILNALPHASTLPYRLDPGTLRLFGPRYSMVRAEFRAVRRRRERPSGRRLRLLVAFGGTDPFRHSARVLDALARDPALSSRIDVRVLMGPGANPGPARRSCARARFPARTIVDAPRVSAIADWADLALTAGGTMVWELLCAGVPALVTSVVDNQRLVAPSLAGAVVDLGPARQLSGPRLCGEVLRFLEESALLERQSRKALRTIDGRGAERTLAALERLARKSRGSRTCSPRSSGFRAGR